MVQLKIFDPLHRPAPPTDANSAAHWVIIQLAHPHYDEAYMGDWYPGTEYKQEWKDAFWHIDCTPLDEYVRRALEKATPHKTPRIDMELPTGVDAAYMRKGPKFIEAAVDSMLSVLQNEPDDLELNIIFPQRHRFPLGFLDALEKKYIEYAHA